MRHKNIIRFSFACLLLITSKSIQAQTNWDTLPWKSYSDYRLQNLNKSYVTTNILYDRMFPLANVDEYSGSLSLSDTTHPDHFMQAYYEIYNSAYNTTGWISPDQMDSIVRYNGRYTQHPIGVFLYKFNSLDTNALQDNLIDTLANGQFVDVAGRPRSPYFTHISFLATPLLAEDQVIEQGTHEFYIDAQFFVQNEDFTITQIRIDFGDGQGEWIVNDPYGGGALQRSFISSIIKSLTQTVLGRITVVGRDILGNNVQYGNPFKIRVKNKKQYFPLTACKGLQQHRLVVVVR